MSRFYWLMAIGVLLGFSVWILQARRRSGLALSSLQRGTLIVVLLAVLFLRWLTEEDFSMIQAGATSSLSALAEKIDMPTPVAASTKQPDIKLLYQRSMLMLPPPSRVEWSLSDNTSAVSVEVAFDPAAYEQGKTNGADMICDLVGKNVTREVFRRRIDPARREADRGILHELVVLPPFESGAKFVLRTEPGEFGDTAWDWIFLSKLRFRRDASLAPRRFPGFNRAPDRVEGDNSALLPGSDGKPYLLLATPSILTYRLRGGEQHLDFDYGFVASAYSNGGKTNGAIFRVELKARDRGVRRLFEYYARPLERAVDRGLLHAHIQLPSVEDKDVLTLSILGGDYDDNSWDHTYVSRLVLE